MKQGIILGSFIIVLSVLALGSFNANISNKEYTDLAFSVKVDGQELVKGALTPTKSKIVWYVQEENGSNLILEDREIIDYYGFSMTLEEVKNPSLVDYELIKKVSGKQAKFNMINIDGNNVSVYEANCGDKTCVKTGVISKAGQNITCVPHKFVVQISGSGGFDA